MLRAAQSVGAVAMAVIGGRLPPWKRPGRVLLIVVALFGPRRSAFGLSTSFPLSVALLVAVRRARQHPVVIRLTLEQMVVPDAIRGRVSAVHYVFIGMSNELGAAESGVGGRPVRHGAGDRRRRRDRDGRRRRRRAEVARARARCRRSPSYARRSD